MSNAQDENTVFTDAQVDKLERNFLRNHYLTMPKLSELSRKLSSNTASVSNWFKNRRKSLRSKKRQISRSKNMPLPRLSSLSLDDDSDLVSSSSDGRRDIKSKHFITNSGKSAIEFLTPPAENPVIICGDSVHNSNLYNKHPALSSQGHNAAPFSFYDPAHTSLTPPAENFYFDNNYSLYYYPSHILLPHINTASAIMPYQPIPGNWSYFQYQPRYPPQNSYLLALKQYAEANKNREYNSKNPYNMSVPISKTAHSAPTITNPTVLHTMPVQSSTTQHSTALERTTVYPMAFYPPKVHRTIPKTAHASIVHPTTVYSMAENPITMPAKRAHSIAQTTEAARPTTEQIATVHPTAVRPTEIHPTIVQSETLNPTTEQPKGPYAPTITPPPADGPEDLSLKSDEISTRGVFNPKLWLFDETTGGYSLTYMRP